MPTSFSIVENIVVHEGRRVNHFNDGCQRPVIAIDLASRRCGQQQQNGPQSLAAKARDVGQHVGDAGKAAFQFAVEFILDGLKVVAQEFLHARQQIV